MIKFFVFTILLILTLPFSAQAYLGPGIAVGFLGSFLGVAGVIILSVVSILLWPIYIIWKKKRAKKLEAENNLKTESVKDSEDK